MKKILALFLLCSFINIYSPANNLKAAELLREKTILFLGDSITQNGQYIEFIEAALVAEYPEHDKIIIPLGLASETVSGLSEEGHAGGQFPRPDLHERLDRALEKTKPDLVFACYGMNDGIYFPLSEERFQAFKNGMTKLHNKVIESKARIIHLTPAVFDPLHIKERLLPAGLKEYPQPFEGYNQVLDAYSQWLIEMKEKQQWSVLDIHFRMNEALKEKRKTTPDFTFSKDGVHPGVEGHLLMAKPIIESWGLKINSDGSPAHPHGLEILNLVRKKHGLLRPAWLSHVGHKRPGIGQGLPIKEAQEKAALIDIEIRKLAKSPGTSFPGKTSLWNGYQRFDFELAEKTVTVVAPKSPVPGNPWVWHGEFFGHKPAPDIALLGKGYHIVYMKINDMLGSPEAVKLWDQCYKEVTEKYHLSARPSLVGLSRGGLYSYNWAIANPDKVSCIYGDAPVCDFKSWPGGKGKGAGDPKNWKLVMELWKFPDEKTALEAKVNPVDNLAPLAKHKVPLLHVFGDADTVVPWEENTGLIETRYKALGGNITLIRKPGVGHHPHGLDDSTPIVEFILKHTR